MYINIIDGLLSTIMKGRDVEDIKGKVTYKIFQSMLIVVLV